MLDYQKTIKILLENVISILLQVNVFSSTICNQFGVLLFHLFYQKYNNVIFPHCGEARMIIIHNDPKYANKLTAHKN